MRLYDGIDIIYRGIYHSLSTWLYFIEYFIHNNTFVFRRRLRRRQQWQRLPYLNGNTKILLPTIGYIIIIRGFYIAFFRYPSSHSHPFHHSLSLSRPMVSLFLYLLWFFSTLLFSSLFFVYFSLNSPFRLCYCMALCVRYWWQKRCHSLSYPYNGNTIHF